MSEGDGGSKLVNAALVLAVLALCIFISYSSSQIRDLQRRVGHLEQQRVRFCADCPNLK